MSVIVVRIESAVTVGKGKAGVAGTERVVRRRR